MPRLTSDGTFSVGQRVRIKQDAPLKQTDVLGLEGVLVNWDGVPEKWGGARWTMESDAGEHFAVKAAWLELV